MTRGLKTWLRWSALASLAIAMLVPASAQAATADLSIALSDTPDPVAEGAVLTYQLEVTNLGPDTATGVTITDELANHVDFVSATASQGSCDRKGKKVTCELGSGAVSEYTPGPTVTIKVRPKKAGQLTNSASVAVGTGDTDPVGANDTDTETTTVVASGGGGGGATCAGQAATILGTAGADTLTGTAGRDVIKARGGNDRVRGLARNDVVCAGGGNDTVKGGSGADLLKGGTGSDNLFGGRGRDTCRGGPGADAEHSC